MAYTQSNTTTSTVQSSTCRTIENGKVPDLSDGARAIAITEYKEAAYALAEAFSDDHVSRYLVDTPDRPHWTEKEKWDLHVSIMEYITYAHCLRGLVITAGENYGCVALW